MSRDIDKILTLHILWWHGIVIGSYKISKHIWQPMSSGFSFSSIFYIWIIILGVGQDKTFILLLFLNFYFTRGCKGNKEIVWRLKNVRDKDMMDFECKDRTMC